MKSILHIINSDKFTNGYIHFMSEKMPEYRHSFIVRGNPNTLMLESNAGHNFTHVRNYGELIQNRSLVEQVKVADRIIISGAFSIQNFDFYRLFLRSSILKKTYFHFWGGDFYSIRNEKPCGFRHPRGMLLQRLRRYVFENCGGLIFLIENEYEEFQKICKVENRHFVAVMGASELRITPAKVEEAHIEREPIFLLGNSAAKTNRHEEIIACFSKRFSEKAYKMYCPLSYGGAEHARQIAELGKQQLPNQFVPMLDFIEPESYHRFLSTVSVGILNCDRQQALGNIALLLAMGKKLYLREGSSMYRYFADMGLKVHSTKELETEDFESICKNDPEEAARNRSIVQKVAESYDTLAIEQWKKVFED